MTDDVQRDLGRMEAQITALITQVSALNVKVDAIDKTLSEARGGWRILLLVGGVAGAVGGLLGRYLPFLGLHTDGRAENAANARSLSCWEAILNFASAAGPRGLFWMVLARPWYRPLATTCP